MLCLKFVVLIVVSNSDTDVYQLPPSSGSNNLQTLVSVHQSEWHYVTEDAVQNHKKCLPVMSLWRLYCTLTGLD